MKKMILDLTQTTGVDINTFKGKESIDWKALKAKVEEDAAADKRSASLPISQNYGGNKDD